jgi:hypothetical protein
MVQRLTVRERETPERARQRFDGHLGVRAWATPGTEYQPAQQRDPKTPWWWEGAEDASQTFLASMGVNLT